MTSDIKISQMPSATSLEGTELIPIVQGGTNKATTPSKIKEGLATVALLNNKVDKDGSKVLSDLNFTTTLKNKLDGIANNANNYVHPTGNGNNHIPQGGAEGLFLGYSAAGTAKWVNAPTTSVSVATSTALGGIKIGYTQSNKNYPIVLDSDSKAYVTIPWTDTVYTHPTTAGNKHIPAGGSSGLILKWSAAGTAVWGNPDAVSITQATSSALGGIKIGYTTSGKNYAVLLDGSGMAYVNVPWTDTTYSVATTSANGLMSSADKSKLDGLTNYILPAAGASIGGVKQGAAVEDATSADDVITVVNALLASLRTSGAIATASAAAAMYRNIVNTTEELVVDFIPPTIIENGKLYKENNIVYKCIQTSKLPISNKLSDLVGYYVEIYKQ